MSKVLFRFMDTVGDGSGSHTANVNGSVTPVTFKYQPAVGEVAKISRLIVHYEDSGSFDVGSYGNGLALTNGIVIEVRRASDDSLLIDLCDGEPIKSNSHWSRMAYDVRVDIYGQGDEALTARWTVSKAGKPIGLSSDEYLAITIRDDLTGLVDQTFMLQGITV